MVGRNKLAELDRLIDEVARGQRSLDSVSDGRLREAIRLALRIHRQSSEALDEYTRVRMRARVLRNLRPHGPTLADHAWTALELLARPAPYLARSIAIAALLLAIGMGATAASADTLPDDLFYPLKVASEGLRLTLAGAAEDRAGVELSIAEHRLAEAEKLAAKGRTSDALVAAAFYSQHIAWAAAELTPSAATSDLPRQLESRFDLQRARARTLAAALADNAKSAPAARILAMIAASTTAPGTTEVQRVANTAADVAEQLVRVAEQAEADAGSATVVFTPASTAALATAAATVAAPVTIDVTRDATARPSSSAVASAKVERSPVASPEGSATPRARETERPRQPETARPVASSGPAGPAATNGNDRATARPSSPRDGTSSEVLKTVRKALEEAKAAADRAKKGK